MKLKLPLFLLLSLALVSCATNAKIPSAPQIIEEDKGRQAYGRIKDALDPNNTSIDYETLMWVYQEMIEHRLAIPHSGELLSSLIKKRNENTRVDHMILILAAHAMGNSQAAIDDVYGLFETMLTMDHRLNTWVLAFIADAIGKYPYDIYDGDRLADLLEQKVSLHTAKSALAKEFFGYHFMPPPKGEYIPGYITGIQDQQTRVFERMCYYTLIKHQWTEAQIEKALIQLQTDGIPGTGEKSPRPLKYLIQHSNRFLN